MSQPVVEGSLGSPPFEKPNIEQVHMKLVASLDLVFRRTLQCCRIIIVILFVISSINVKNDVVLALNFRMFYIMLFSFSSGSFEFCSV